MRYSVLIVIAFFMISHYGFCQINDNPESFKIYSFKCFNRIDSIKLPDDLIGPKYFYYGEGAIVSFISSDSITISILCGSLSTMSVGSMYSEVDSIKTNGRLTSIRYINKTNNRYARHDYNSRYDILYRNVPYLRKDKFDLAFDIMIDNEQLIK